jgi:nucleotide-binding universal stress UspA family protein
MKTTLEESPPAKKASSTFQERAAVDRHRAGRIKIKNILVPLDFSDGSMEAFDYATLLANQFGAEIQLVHVQMPDEACAVPGAGHLIRECAEAATLIHQKLGYLEPERPPQFWPENCHIRVGHPDEEICKLARELDVELIVLGSRGNTGLKRLLLGSTAERVVRFSPCPVLVVRKFKKSEFRVGKILVPTDFSHCAMAGLSYAAHWAKTFDARLRLLHVLFPAAPVLIDRVATNLATEAIGIPIDLKLEMEALTKLDFVEGIQCEPQIKIGYTIDAICAETNDVDLVIISTHGRSGLQRGLIGSVAEHVVRYAECPVLVVPSRCRVA